MIGDEPINTKRDRKASEGALPQGEGWSRGHGVVARHQPPLAAHRVPCGEASRRAGCGKSARPVR